MTAPLIVPHSDTAAIEISRSRDGSRLSIGVLTRPNAGAPWRPTGPAPSVPMVMLDTLIAGLI